ncbi:MAG: VWA domain-containing protein [Actinobacteria bacterium]|nr:VWA domain-containing protein [Actinomycetota bacterium]
MTGSLVFLTPLGLVAAAALALPLAGLAFASRREESARRLLRLPAPPPVQRLGRAAALAAVPLVLGVAATQPALRSKQTTRVRTDAEAFFLVDISRSMSASRTPSSPTRLARAKDDALRLRDAIPQVPSGIATLTDRALPMLFPNADLNVFAATLRSAVSIEEPGPTTSNVLATTFCQAETCPLGSLATQNFFGAGTRRRLVVLLTDGESGPLDLQLLSHELGTTKLVIVHVWSPTERVYDGTRPEEGYHVHPESTALLAQIAQAVNGHVFTEGALGAAAAALRTDLGSGPTKVLGRTERTRTLAPYVALLALLPLAYLLRGSVTRGLAASLRELLEELLDLSRVNAAVRARALLARPADR